MRLCWTLTGRFAGDLALAFLTKGGVTFAGGILPRILNFCDLDAFRAAFENKAPYGEMMRTIGTRLILTEDAVLTGMAAIATAPQNYAINYALVPGSEISAPAEPNPGSRRANPCCRLDALRKEKPARAGCPSLRLFWRENHDHLAAFHGRLGLDLGDASGLGFHPFEQAESQFLMRHLAAAKAQSDFHLVAFLEKPAHGFHFDDVIMVVNSRAQFDLLDLDDLLLFPSFRGFFLLQEPELAVIKNFADRGIGRRNNFDEIKSRLIGHLLGLNSLDHAEVFAFGID